MAAYSETSTTAIERYEGSLAIRERAVASSLLSNLGVIAEYRGEQRRHDEARESAPCSVVALKRLPKQTGHPKVPR